jgi:Zn-dependent peptidase ImmA (M78 family)
MSHSSALINKATLKTIRERKGVSYEFVVLKTKLKQEKLKAWEDCSKVTLPTINQAKTLAKCYHIPFAGLYMRPEDINIKPLPKAKNMRTLFEESNFDESSLNLAIIDLLNVRDFLIDTKKKLKEPIDDFKISYRKNDVSNLANTIRTYFNIQIETQLSTSSKRKFYLYVRKQIEAKGIMIHCFTGVDIRCARGVSIFFNRIPIIGVNNEDRYPAKTFTIIHELVHLLRRESTYCNDFYDTFTKNSEEVFCNAVAGEFLVPEEYLATNKKILDYKDNLKDTDVENLANRFSVSREVIIRRLLDLGYITQKNYEERNLRYKMEYVQEKSQQREERKENGSRGIPRNIPRETIDKNSENLYKTLYRGYNRGLFDKQDIARYLEVKQKHIDKVLIEVMKG